jgi:hypothetical protein
MFYVYEWYIIDTGEIIYVGKGCNRRYKVTKHNRFFNEMIKRNKCESRIIKTFNTEKEAFEYEFQRIVELKNIGQCVCNIYDGGFGGSVNWWTDEIRKKYSENNVMKSINHRKRMKSNNPMSNPIIAEKTNGQKRRKVIIGNQVFISIKDAKETLGVSYSNLITWNKKGITPDGKKIQIEPQKQHWNKNMHGNQQPSQRKTDKSTLEGSTTNE